MMWDDTDESNKRQLTAKRNYICSHCQAVLIRRPNEDDKRWFYVCTNCNEKVVLDIEKLGVWDCCKGCNDIVREENDRCMCFECSAIVCSKCIFLKTFKYCFQCAQGHGYID